MPIKTVCEICALEFNARVDQIKRGNGRFCSRSCKGLGQPRESLHDRFWAKVDTSKGENSCWEWQAFKNQDGYGIIGIGGKKCRSTHRVSYELNVGVIPSDLQVLHRCDNRACCNPKHLFLGTQEENIRDMIEKGRNVYHKGEKAPGAKLLQKEVNEIRASYSGVRGQKQALAKKYGVRIQTIINVINNVTWIVDTDQETPT